MDSTDRDTKRKKQGSFRIGTGSKRVNWRWIITISICAFLISVLISVLSSAALSGVTNIIIAFLVLALIISMGILFDLIGVAVQAADETPFHSMSARKVKGAHHSIRIIRNSEKVSSFCNDVVGDIAGIVSGSTVAAIVLLMSRGMNTTTEMLTTLAMTGLVSAFTIGGKAICKTYAMNHSNTVVYLVGLIWSTLDIWQDKK